MANLSIRMVELNKKMIQDRMIAMSPFLPTKSESRRAVTKPYAHWKGTKPSKPKSLKKS